MTDTRVPECVHHAFVCQYPVRRDQAAKFHLVAQCAVRVGLRTRDGPRPRRADRDSGFEKVPSGKKRASCHVTVILLRGGLLR